jgi:DNA-binding GntR family transcriptional regulator
MIPASQKLLEEYEQMASKAAPHIGPADFQTLQGLLRKIQVHIAEGEPPTHPEASVPDNILHPELIQAATSMDRILSTRFDEAGARGEFDAHIYRVQSFIGRWPL